MRNDIRHNSDMWQYHFYIILSLPRGTTSAWHVAINFLNLKKFKRIKIKNYKNPRIDLWHPLTLLLHH